MTAADINTIKNGVGQHIAEAFESKTSGKPRFKTGYVTTPTTADDGDVVTIDMYQLFGMTRLMGIRGFTHSTEDSVIIIEAPTTVVNGTEVQVTIGGSTDNKKRCFVLYGL